MYDELQPGFARHKGGASGPVAEQLWGSKKVAIHWEDYPSADPDDYEGRASTEISNLNSFAKDGAIVGASFRDVTKTEMLVGVIEPESSVEILNFNDSELQLVDKVEPGKSTEKSAGDGRILKGVQLSEVKEISIDDYPVLFESSVRPRFWSVSNWWNGEEHLRAIAKETSKPFEVKSLQPDQLEVVCEEYLRIVDKDYASLTSTGGTSADVDISGVSGETRIWGQVTFGNSGDVKSKISNLGDYTGDSTKVLMFAPENSRPNDVPEGITYLPVEAVFSTVSLNSSGRSMLEEMLNIS